MFSKFSCWCNRVDMESTSSVDSSVVLSTPEKATQPKVILLMTFEAPRSPTRIPLSLVTPTEEETTFVFKKVTTSLVTAKALDEKKGKFVQEDDVSTDVSYCTASEKKAATAAAESSVSPGSSRDYKLEPIITSVSSEIDAILDSPQLVKKPKARRKRVIVTAGDISLDSVADVVLRESASAPVLEVRDDANTLL